MPAKSPGPSRRHTPPKRALAIAALCSEAGIGVTATQAESYLRARLQPSDTTPPEHHAEHWRALGAYMGRGKSADRAALSMALDGWPTPRLAGAVERSLGNATSVRSTDVEDFAVNHLDPRTTAGRRLAERGSSRPDPHPGAARSEADTDLHRLGQQVVGLEDTIGGIFGGARYLVSTEAVALAADATGLADADVEDAMKAYATFAADRSWWETCRDEWRSLPPDVQVAALRGTFDLLPVWRHKGLLDTGGDDITTAAARAPLVVADMHAFVRRAVLTAFGRQYTALAAVTPPTPNQPQR